MKDKSESEKSAMFLHLIGEEGREIHENMIFANEEKDKIEPLYTKFAEHCNPRKNITVEGRGGWNWAGI